MQAILDHKTKRRWVAALRGNTYHQVFNVFTDSENGRCALGVLIELAPTEMAYGKKVGWMHTKVNRVNRAIISGHNDRGLPFSDIADLIEERL